MASSSKSINMPLMFAVSIGATVSLVAIVIFALAWFEYEQRVVLKDQVLTGPTHDVEYDKHLAQQQANLAGLDEAKNKIVAEQAMHDGHQGGHNTP